MKSFYTTIFTIFIIIFTSCHNNKTSLYNLIIGTYNSTADSVDCIYVYDFNTETGDFNFKSKVWGEDFPTYLAVSNNGENVYFVNQVREGGKVSSFGFNSSTGELTFLNRVSSGGRGATFISVDDARKFIYVANYDNGSLSAVPINDDGSLGTGIQTFQSEGSSIIPGRQDSPHVHSAVLSPDNKLLLSADLGTDRLFIYNVDLLGNTQPLIPADPPFVFVKPGSGPRHSTFHPNSKYAYLLTEMAGTIYVYDIVNGNLSEKQTATIISPDYKGPVSAADIHTSPDGKFLYASSRGEANEIVIFSIDKNGMLTYVNRQSTLGKKPRNFAIAPSGDWLLVGNEDSNEIVIFKRDQKTGLLNSTGNTINIIRPNCIKFSPVN